MGRKKKKNINKRILSFIITFLMMSLGIYYYGLNYVPDKWYETQTMMPNQPESYYVNQWCTADFGRKEAILWDSTRVDCLAKDYAIEFDFAKKWAESVGQSLYYSKMTGKKPAIALILTNLTDYRYLKRIERLDNDIKVFLIKAY
jgi:disulfide bond formation protein DsbB